MGEVAKAASPREILSRQLMSDEFLAKIGNVLPANLPAKRLAQQALTLTSENPRLLECTPASFMIGIMKAAELHLMLSGPLGHAYLVPRRNNKKNCTEATFQIGYRGFETLAWRSNQVRMFAAHEVREGDRFSFQLGTDPSIHHEWSPDRATSTKQEEGKFTHYYAVAAFTTGGKDFRVMTHKEMVEHRARYSPKGKYPSAWDTDWLPMALKTMLRRLGKHMPMATELQNASMLDEYGEAGVDRQIGSSHAGTAGLMQRLEIEEEPPESTGEVIHEDDKGDSYEGTGPTTMKE